ncbi:MAG: acyl-CoA dehydrogenase family protein [Dehalococcoidia bacterium]|uniref:acyl-CoA dehydrogenase family protein n=1 Tax=Candidatus Amarobacter glycogenicus TaxID=3140699 RepID=UPI0031372BA4|nr:acyl-CoA dehydrogenase family protein [Dehalococcoidia bacterium]MBK8559607.1 acyl-CoA dehydrogenase family protein [Dehalococcoidia bacterium]MBK9547292.1 acyl-CoA dehydrogenase family protein [Dehalococcoidia bacterium]
MEFVFSPEQEVFRERVRTFIKDNWTPPPRTARPGDNVTNEAEREYEKRLANNGWLTMAWPKEYGGLAASHMEQLIFREESGYAGAPGGGGQGISMVGPCLMVHGSDSQKREHLPKIASGEVHWGQGFSEPGSGSDLASLQTRAVRDGDDFVINGQKIWTSGAHHADWFHVLTRTAPDAPKHRGISYFLVNAKAAGITVRPLINMLGDHEFNEVFFEDVRVPAENMMGEENRGWYVATTLLDFERSGVNWSASGRRQVEELTKYARETDGANGRLIGQREIRNGLANLRIEVEASRLLSYQVVWMQSRGKIPNYEASMSKAFGSELGQRIANFGMRLIGLGAQRIDANDPGAPLGGSFGRAYLRTVPGTIAAGTSEVQRNIIATRGLGLPRG